jgi:hypothetical protein
MSVLQDVEDALYNVFTARPSPGQLEAIKQDTARGVVRAGGNGLDVQRSWDEIDKIDKINRVDDTRFKFQFAGKEYIGSDAATQAIDSIESAIAKVVSIPAGIAGKVAGSGVSGFVYVILLVAGLVLGGYVVLKVAEEF